MGTPSRQLNPRASSTRPTATRRAAESQQLHQHPGFPHPLEDDTAILLRISSSRMEEEQECPTSAVSDDEVDEGTFETATTTYAGRRVDIWSVNDGEDSAAMPGGPPQIPPLSASWVSSFRQSAPSSPSHGLESLRQDPVPPLPDEQDRKRFIGCLAAVLASSCDFYSYGKWGSGGNVDKDDDVGFGNAGNVGDGVAGDASTWKEQLSRTESWAFSCDDDEDEDESNELASGDDRDGIRCSRRRVGRDDCDGSANSSLDCDSQSFGSAKATASTLRHRQRWYSVCTKLLLSSAELLQIDKGQAKGFLPMLSKILVPSRTTSIQPSPLSSNHPSSHLKQSRLEQQRDRRMGRDRCTLGPGGVEGVSRGVRRVVDDNSTGAPTATTDGELLIKEQLDRIEHIRPFLEGMTPGAGFRCLSFFMLQHLMHSPDGYDARVRRSIKVLGVLLLVREMENDPVDYLAELEDSSVRPTSEAVDRTAKGAGKVDRLVIATRKFEALEQYLATKLLQLSQQKRPRGEQGVRRLPRSSASFFSGSQSGVSREQILRGLKIGGTAVVAGTLFAVTGGLAAPGIAAGVAAIAGGTAAAAAATAVLTSTAAVTAIFGVGGGGLAAYKMRRRTKGLTEFEFHKESDSASADLFLTVAISGWLRDSCDFQRPWGVCPTNPPLRDRLELLERFYFVHSPDHVLKCRRILQSWEGEEDELWKTLLKKYGRDPSSLFPLHGPRTFYKLTLEQEEVVDMIFVELGYVASELPHMHSNVSLSCGGDRTCRRTRSTRLSSMIDPTTRVSERLADEHVEERLSSFQRDSLHGPITSATKRPEATLSAVSQSANGGNDTRSILDTKDDAGEKPAAILKHLSTVWDYRACYGGELYTVKWEGDLMLELCDSVSDLAFELVSGGTAQILKHTALSTIMSAIAWPYALVNAANMIDSTWTLAVERADEAGLELARSLLFSSVGHRPVTLIGFSFGARAIYSCLKELSRHQTNWEAYHLRNSDRGHTKGKDLASFYKEMREPASIVEDAILMGLPNHLSTSSWIACRQVVAGRLVNCFSQKDLILSLMFQFKRLGLKPVCGTCPVNVDGVENVDVSDIISGHQDYCVATGKILHLVRQGQPFPSNLDSAQTIASE